MGLFFDFDKLDYKNLKYFEMDKFRYTFFIEDCYKDFFIEEQNNYYDDHIDEIDIKLAGVHYSEFKSFFKDLNIDTPYILNKTPSLHRLKGKTRLLRLTTYLMRHGKKATAIKLLLNAFYHPYSDLRSFYSLPDFID